MKTKKFILSTSFLMMLGTVQPVMPVNAETIEDGAPLVDESAPIVDVPISNTPTNEDACSPRVSNTIVSKTKIADNKFIRYHPDFKWDKASAYFFGNKTRTINVSFSYAGVGISTPISFYKRGTGGKIIKTSGESRYTRPGIFGDIYKEKRKIVKSYPCGGGKSGTSYKYVYNVYNEFEKSVTKK